ncbi:helix-turn-helix domain-containing protein [Enterococcus faecalis]|uniref:helix-turn-helix domain-containing protein n=1 Tax=Enterococcus faecalis TaxID=1351 RepID=UPI00178451A5|nr:helix-turn-helix domain-containing protein [Enterococcus faecalis]MBD9891892.1 helix-turn-helix domain-containing protein [Enterococcus faecalis]MCD5102503.1 helix-turn-helix domain-containing protein [Enterococcus faecalis]
MNTFLTKSSQKKIKLFNYLLEKNKWRTITDLKELLNVSSKSILLYVEELSGIFKQFNGKIELKNENNQRFYIYKEENFPIYNIYLYYYRQSYNYNLIDYMYKYPERNLEDYADAQFTSVSTVFRYAKLLVRYFKRYNMTFHTFSLELNNKESQIRSFYYYFYWNSSRSGGWPFTISEEQIIQYIERFEKIYELKLLRLPKRIFAYWLAIILERSPQKRVEFLSETKQVADDDKAFPLLKLWVKNCNLSLPEEEIYFIYRMIYSFGVIDGNPRYEGSHALAHKLHHTTSYQAVLLLNNIMQKDYQFQLDLSDSELIFNFVAFHERSQFFFGNTDLFFNQSYINEIKSQNIEISRLMETLHRDLQEQATGEVKEILKNWEQLFLNYYYVLDYYDLLLKKLEPVKILIADDLHHTHRLWLMNKIKHYFDKAYPLVFHDYEADVSEVDLVISNYYFDTKGTYLLLMKNIPTERNWRNLEKILYKITHSNDK